MRRLIVALAVVVAGHGAGLTGAVSVVQAGNDEPELSKQCLKAIAKAKDKQIERKCPEVTK